MRYFICEDRVELYNYLVPKTMNNKKTPANFATTSALSALNAIVAVTALTGIASSITPTVKAETANDLSYNAETQMAQQGSMTNLWTNTNGTSQTSSYTYRGQYAPGPDDNNGYSDSDN